MIENRFRPPYEWASVTAALAAAGLLLSQAFIASSAMTQGVALLGLAALSGIRTRQAWRIHRSRRNLRRLQTYVLTPDQIPWFKDYLFLGKGFRWLPKHTQRLHLVRQPQFEALLSDSRLYKAARKIERESNGQSWLCKYTRSSAWWNPVPPLPPVGGSPEIHGIELDEEDICMDIGERVGHTFVPGTTRVGKTRLAELLITQDIRRGDVVIVFDPKGDAALLKRMYAEAVRAGRAHQFMMFHLGYPDLSCRYNPVGNFGKVTEVATRTAGPLPSEGQSATFRQFVWRFVNVMARAMSALGLKPTYKEIYKYAVNIDGLCMMYFDHWLDRDAPGWRQELKGFAPDGKAVQEKIRKTGRTDKTVMMLMYLQQKGFQDEVGNALSSVMNNDRTYFDKLVSSLYPLLEKLTTGEIAGLLSPDYEDVKDTRAILDWSRVVDTGGIVYFGLDALTDYEVAGAVGNAAFADLVSLAGKLYKFGQNFGQRETGGARKIALHADEFNELIGDEFIPMVNKAGGAGFQVTAYTQTVSDIEAKIGSKSKAGQVVGNFNNLIMLRVKEIATAELLTAQLPKVRINTATIDSGTRDDPNDLGGYTTSTKDVISSTEVDMLQAADLVVLPKGQAFALINGGQLFKIRIPLASDLQDDCMPDSLQSMVASMESRYLKSSSDEALLFYGNGAGW